MDLRIEDATSGRANACTVHGTGCGRRPAGREAGSVNFLRQRRYCYDANVTAFLHLFYYRGGQVGMATQTETCDGAL